MCYDVGASGEYNTSRLMGSSDFTTLNELFLKAIEKYDKPDCLLYKSDGRYRGISSREALRKAAALASALERLGARPGEIGRASCRERVFITV